MDEGKCIGCGYCCKWIHRIHDNTAEGRVFVPTRGMKIFAIKGELMIVAIPLVCPQYSRFKGICAIHDRKPEVCRNYPGQNFEPYYRSLGFDPNDAVPDSCGFKGTF